MLNPQTSFKWFVAAGLRSNWIFKWSKKYTWKSSIQSPKSKMCLQESFLTTVRQYTFVYHGSFGMWLTAAECPIFCGQKQDFLTYCPNSRACRPESAAAAVTRLHSSHFEKQETGHEEGPKRSGSSSTVQHLCGAVTRPLQLPAWRSLC